MQFRLVAICAVFVVLGAAIFYFTQPTEPETSTEPVTTAPRTQVAAPDPSAEPIAVEEVADSVVDVPADGISRVYGRVLDARTQEPLPGAVISVSNPGEELPESVTADSSGVFELRVRSDQGRLISRADGYSMSRVPLPNPLGAEHQIDISMRLGSTIVGKVVERGTREPIEGITVHAAAAGAGLATLARERPGDSPRRAEDKTDEDGNFLLSGLEAGSYRVLVQARDAGFLFTSDMAEVLTLDEGDVADGVYFELERGAIVVGMVRDPNGQPLASARVRAVGQNQLGAIVRGMETQDPDVFADLSTRTDDQGRFELPGLSFETEYHLQGSADGFATTASNAFAIPRSQRRATMDLQLTLGSIVSGMLQLADGTPVPEQHLLLMPRGESMMSMGFGADLSVRSDEYGSFTFERVPAGAYALSIIDRSEYYLSESYPIEVDGASLYDGILLVAEETGDSPFGLGVITGLVLDTGGRPAPGVTVAARPAFIERRVATAETGPDGRFELSQLPGRRFDVFARTDYGRATEEGVAVGADIVLQLRPPARVSGIVIDAQNRPVPDTEVRLERTNLPEPSDPGEEILQAVGGMMGPGEGVQRTEVNGHFVFAEVDPGEYSVHATNQTLGAGESYTFTVYEGQDLSNVQVKLEPGVVFSGRVQDGAGQPVSGALIRLTAIGPGGELQQMMANFMPMGAGGQTPSGASQRDGRFELTNVIPGEYMLEATHAHFAKTVQRGITVSRGGDVRNHLVTMTPGGTARGRYAPGGQPQANAMILMLGESGMQMTSTAFDGSFSVDNLTSGSYMLFPMRFDATDPADFLDLINQAQVVDIEDGGMSDIDFNPPAGGQPVTGSIETDPNSITVITLRRPGGPDPATINPLNMLEAMRALRYQVAAGVANPDGSFSFDSVPPGNYVLDALTIDASMMNNPDPSMLFNLDQFPRITQEVTVGNSPLNINLQF